MLGFTSHKFAIGIISVLQETFDSNQFALDPYLTFTFITAFTFSEFIHQLAPFSLDPFLTFS